MAALPLGFNRNFQSLVATVPGVTRPHREHSQFFNSQDSLRFEVNGQPGMASNTLIEGLDDNQKTGLLQVIIPAADALETVSVTTSNYDAEFGRSGGAVTNVTLKSGTNDFKGSGFFFGNNNSTNASDYLTAPQGADQVRQRRLHARRPDRQEQAVLLRRLPAHDRQQRLRRARHRADGEDAQRRLQRRRPTASTIRRRARRRRGTRRPFANNLIPQDRISPIARKLLGFIPAAEHRRRAFGQNNFQQAQTREKTTDGFDTKVSYTASAKDQVCFRLSFMRPDVFDPGLYGELRRPGQRRLRRHRHQHQLQRRRHLDPRLQREDRARRPRRLELLPQRHLDDRQRPDDERRRRHSRREHRRVHQRAVADQHRRLLGSGARVLGQPAVGSLGEDLELQRRADQAVAVAHREGRRRVPPQRRHAAADAGCRRTARPVRLQLLRHRQPRRRGVDRPASPTRSRRSCSTGRTPCSATSRSSTGPARSTPGSSRSPRTSGRCART